MKIANFGAKCKKMAIFRRKNKKKVFFMSNFFKLWVLKAKKKKKISRSYFFPKPDGFSDLSTVCNGAIKRPDEGPF